MANITTAPAGLWLRWRGALPVQSALTYRTTSAGRGAQVRNRAASLPIQPHARRTATSATAA